MVNITLIRKNTLSNKTDMSSRKLFLSSPHFWPNSNEKKKKNTTITFSEYQKKPNISSTFRD